METIEDDTLDSSAPAETIPTLTHLSCEKCGLEVWLLASQIQEDPILDYGAGTVLANRPGLRGHCSVLRCPSHGQMNYFLRIVELTS
jgi:hypothetical protein